MRGGYFGTRPFGVPGWHRWCSRAPSGRVAVCVRGRRPARSPSALRAFGSARRLEARPGPAAAHGHRGHALRTGGAVSLCVVARPCRRPWTPRSSPPGPLAHSAPAAPSAPVALCRCVWRSGPAAAHGHRGYALRTGGAVSLCVVARPCRRPRIPRPCLRALRHPPPCGLTWFRVWQTQAGKLRSGQWGLFYGRCPIRLLRGLCGPCGAEAGTSPCRGAIGPHRRIQKRPGP